MAAEVLEQRSEIAVPQTAIRIAAGFGAAAMAAGAAMVYYVDPSKPNFLPVCPLFTMTGYACPGCGMTRGFHALFHGDIISAIDFNALIPFWALLFGYGFLGLLVTAVRGRGFKLLKFNPLLLWLILFVVVAFGVLRNIPVWPFTILFP